jgi:hypothetical protein
MRWQPRWHVIGGDGQQAPEMSHITLKVPDMINPPGRYDATVGVAGDDSHPTDPAAFGLAASQTASSMNASVVSAHTAEEIIWDVAWPYQAGLRRLRSPWPSWPTRSTRRIRSGHPAGGRPVPAVVRRFEEHRLPKLVVAAGARDLDVSHAAAAPGSFLGRLAQARRPADLRVAGPQLVTERTGFRLVLEQRNGHLNDHALASCHQSTPIVTCADDRYQELAEPPRISGWSHAPPR